MDGASETLITHGHAGAVPRFGAVERGGGSRRRPSNRTPARAWSSPPRRIVDGGGVRGRGGSRKMEGPRDCRSAAPGRFRIRRRALARLGPRRYGGIRPGITLCRWTTTGNGENGVVDAVAVPSRADDAVDWKRGDYAITTRSGRVESDAGWGAAKRATRMITEGSVLVAPAEPRGSVSDVAPEGFPHPVYRAGYALAIPIPLRPPIAREALRPWRRPHEVSRDVPHAHAGGRRAEAFADRLHGLARSRQRAGSTAHLQTAGEGSAP